VLQAYVDDSMEAGKVLVFAGFISSPENWREFSSEWMQALRLARWQSFKMSEIAGSGSKDRLERAGYFYRLIEEHVAALVTVAVDIEALRLVVCELGLPEEYANPYAVIYRVILDYTAQSQHEIGFCDPVDFIFDMHGSRQEVAEGFRLMMQHIPDEERARFGEPPRFENDNVCMPLQAADLLAWHVRKHWLKHGTILGPPFEMSWPARRAIDGFRANLDYDELKPNLQNWLIAFLRQFGAPGVAISISFTDLKGQKF